MLDYVKLFWDFFFFPILNYETFDFMAVVALCLVLYAVYRFTLEVLTCFM